LGRIVETLDEQGQTAEAKKLQATIETALDEVGHSLQNLQRRPTSSTKRHGTLPPRCEGCGAALIADEVEWQDASTARCAYCGAVAKTKIM
jgi:predicted Zn-ribbon and HTH transcriptional regulator